MQPLAAELRYINGLLRRAVAGELHLPDSVTEVEDDDDKLDPEDTVLSKGRSRSTEPNVYLSRKRKEYESSVPLDQNLNAIGYWVSFLKRLSHKIRSA
jgi:hypothetical protein